MNKFLRITSLAATVAALAVSATPALAVNASSNASARARIFQPLKLKSTQSLDLGIIVLSGTASYTSTVGIAKDCTFNSHGNSGNVTCSGAHQYAVYNLQRSNNQPVTVQSGTVTLADGNGNTIDLTPDHDAVVTLTNSGSPGTDFNVGGSIQVTDATVEGVYTGTFAVTADYQ